MANYIPFEIQAEIMKRLPTKSLMQFRSVSKQWKCLINSSKFIADYSFNHTHQQHVLVSYLESKTSEQKHLSFIDDDTFPNNKLSLSCPLPALTPYSSFPIILGSSYGLFCIYTYCGVPAHYVEIFKPVVIWNPSIRKSVAIDVPDLTETNLYNDIGFGVCPHTRDPKILKIAYTRRTSNSDGLIRTIWHFKVYTLSSRAWRSIPAIKYFRQSIRLKYAEQVVIDGFIYWLAYDNGTKMISIVTFDITNENFMEVSLPNTLARSQNQMFTSKLKESLVVVEVVDEAEKQVYGVWMMDPDVSNTFIKLFTINSPEATPKGSLLGFRKNNEPMFKIKSSDSDSDDLVVNEVNSEYFSYVGISWNGISVCASSYMETLLLLDYSHESCYFKILRGYKVVNYGS